jgi:valyl-tRNA synthetase
MAKELAKVYEPKKVEAEVSKRWLAAGAFDADPADPRAKFCIVIPPPNVTDVLHVGHAMNNTLQDVLVRFKRMGQFNTLWMPGTDHAGIATQTVVDKRLKAEGQPDLVEYRRLEAAGKNGRRQFVAKVQAWKDEYESRILGQLKTMGCSCDWQRTRFTMDEICAAAVRAAFFKLFADGLIYRGKRLVNWDPATQTVLADDEVEYEEVQDHFYYLKYPLTEAVKVGNKKIEHVTVATTRPETMLGDTAVAMNPADPRAKHLVGQKVRLPIAGRIIPIIADDHVVLPDPQSDDEKARYSTGFLKVTPAHDPDDYAIGQRHDLPMINVMAPDGTISDKHGWDDWDTIKNPDVENLIGMDRFEAREAIVEWFRKENLLEDIRPYTHQVGHSYRSHVPIEPYLSDQWYIAVKKSIPNCESRVANRELVDKQGLLKGTDVPDNSLAGLALAPLLDGRLKFTPARYADTYRSWLENLRDWPISRQLWWGHRIPVWSFVLGPDPARPVPRFATPEQWRADLSQRALDKLKTFLERYEFSSELSAYEYSNRIYVCPRDRKCDALLDALAADGQRDDAQDYRPGSGERLRGASPIPSEIKLHWKEAHDFLDYVEGYRLERDPDVLDTWFSSALWPFSTMGWPKDTPELKKYYPGDVLCTAREIITLWVSRMVMMGQYCVGDIPFPDVFIHAMIQDGEGRKMSKSLGNGIDPLDIIDSHGADAMRFTLVSMTTQTQDVRMPVEEMTLPDGRTCHTSPKFDAGRNFCNKLWNAARFILMNLQGQPSWEDARAGNSSGEKNLADAWILSRLNGTIRDATAALEGYRFNELAETLYHFMWDEFCDWYVEIAKSRINAGEAAPKAVLAHCMDVLLRLLHPTIPFITEAIWANLNEVAPVRGPGDQQAEPLLVCAAWPMADARAIHEKAEKDFALLAELIRQIRNARSQHNVPPSKKLSVSVEAAGQAGALITANTELLKSQANLAEVAVSSSPITPPTDAAAVMAAGVKLYVLGLVDRDAETQRLEKQAQTLRRGVEGIEGKLANADFLAKAPPAVIQRERQRLEQLKTDLAAVEKSLAAMK